MAVVAYAALVSLLNTLDQIQIHPLLSTAFNNYPIESLREKIDLFLDFVKKFSSDAESCGEAEELVRRIAVVAREAEDIIEVHASHTVKPSKVKWIVARQSQTFLSSLQRIIDETDSIEEQIIKETGNHHQLLLLHLARYLPCLVPPVSCLLALLPPPASSSSAPPPTPTVEKPNSTSDERSPSLLPDKHNTKEDMDSINKKVIMVGFEGYLEQLLDQLTRQHSGSRQILPIVGMGGIVKFGKKRGADAKSAARGGKRPRSVGRSASSSDQGQQLGLTGPTAPDFCSPTVSPPHKLLKSAEVIDISGRESIGRVVKWLESGVEQMAARHEDEKDHYSEQLTAIRARLGKAKDEVKTVKAELAAQLAKTVDVEVEAERARDDVKRLEAELKAARGREAKSAAGQGEVLRAFAKRLLLSEHFSGLANELAGLINGNNAVDALEEAAKDFPDLDVSKYGYERLEGAALLTRYAEVIRDHLGHLPVLDDLASLSEMLTAEQVAACSTDRDPDLDAAFESLPDGVEEEGEKEEAEQEREIRANEDPDLSKSAEGPGTSGAGDIAEGSLSGQPPFQEKEVGGP